MQKLYEEVRNSVANEWEAIHAIFPNASVVIQVFVQRIFAQSIQNFIEVLMQESQAISMQLYLEVLSHVHKETANLVADIHGFDINVICPLLGAPALASILDRSIEDLFVPYVDESRYVTTDEDWMRAGFKAEMAQFLEAWVRTNLF